ncbi:hypothetical protein NGB36_32500 [Streptomyces sp. RB6PN25]|uniref:Uncharacterized protein n=1 Tax=Streptomyces humicola TaxID=2953240 RepID=A0ABT1Q5G8_9ACTN|nr:hypothetical protein [Streptomyces humicola]MCQ4085157.1 hypothetical protein [Streptomyces humicola]
MSSTASRHRASLHRRITHRRTPSIRRRITYYRYFPARHGFRTGAVAMLFVLFLSAYAGIFLYFPH